MGSDCELAPAGVPFNSFQVVDVESVASLIDVPMAIDKVVLLDITVTN